MFKYGQEDLFNLWQMGWQSLIRLTLLAISIGGVATIFWWSLHSPSHSFYYLFHYWYSWLYCFIPFGCSQVARNNLQVLQPFIDRLGQLIRSCTVVFALTSFLSGVGLRLFFVQYSRNLEKARYLRGARLLRAEELNSEIDAARDNQGRLKYKASSSDLYLGREKVRLPASLTFRHIGVAGVSGTGKTQLISSILQQLALQRGHKCLILDLNGQYYSRFGQEGDKILSLFDKRSESWSFYGENVPAQFFAQALVEVNESGNNKFFGNAGRALMTDIISNNDSISGICQDLTSKPDMLLAKLKDGVSPALLGAPEQAAGVIATASVELGFLKHLNWRNKSEEFFSFSDWVLSQSEEWVFLIVKDIDLAATKPLLRLWVDLVVGGVLQREENKDYPHLWVMADELPGLGLLPSLGKLLSQGRKYKSTVAAGYQTQGQIQDLYGDKQAQEIFAGLQNKFIFRTPDPTAAKEESLTLGEQEVEQVNSNGQLGEGVEGDRHSLQRSIQTRAVVMASQLQNLADLKAYVKLCEFNPTLISFDYKSLPQINEPSKRQIPPNTQGTNSHQKAPSGEKVSSKQESPTAREEDGQWDIDPDKN